MRKAMWILWPSFIVAGVAEVLFFTVIDPRELYFLGDAVEWGRMATYSVGFLLFWGLAAASSAFTCFLQRSSAEVNRPKLEGNDLC